MNWVERQASDLPSWWRYLDEDGRDTGAVDLYRDGTGKDWLTMPDGTEIPCRWLSVNVVSDDPHCEVELL